MSLWSDNYKMMEPGFDSRVPVLKQHIKGPKRAFNLTLPFQKWIHGYIGNWLMVACSGKEKDGINFPVQGA